MTSKLIYGIAVYALGCTSGILIMTVWNDIHKDTKPSEPTKVCRDGSLYEVTHEGNITIYDRKAFMSCEEK